MVSESEKGFTVTGSHYLRDGKDQDEPQNYENLNWSLKSEKTAESAHSDASSEKSQVNFVKHKIYEMSKTYPNNSVYSGQWK